jgi:uncharacterized delta-60 repeat protein
VRKSLLFITCLACLAGCGGPPETDRDASTDASIARVDSGPDVDAGSDPDPDGGPVVEVDGGPPDGGRVFPTGPSGALDDTFGEGGLVDGLGFDGRNIAQSIVVQDDQRILIGGYVNTGEDAHSYIARLLENGELDRDFADDGVFMFNRSVGGNESINDLALTDDGSILAAVNANAVLTLLKLDSSGEPVAAFGDEGFVAYDAGSLDNLNAIAVDENGITIAGTTYADAVVGRLDSTDGSLLPSFNGGELLLIDLDGNDHALAVAHDGDDIVIAGQCYGGDSQGFVARVTAAGELDDTFSDDGLVLLTELAVESLMIRRPGYIVAGTGPDGFRLTRFERTGDRDRAFGTLGYANLVTPGGGASMYGAIAVGAGEGYAVGAADGDIVLAAWLAGGEQNEDFGTDGAVVTGIDENTDWGYEIARTPDGRLIVAGSTNDGGDSRLVLLRYFP